MTHSSPKTSFLLRAGILLALLAVAWRWPPVSVEPAVHVPKPESTDPPTPAVAFANRDDAIVFAFERFAREQHEDGSWGPHNDAGQAVEPPTTETTALVLLALASAGQTHRQGKYADNVQRGLDYLLNAGKVDDELAPRPLILPARGQTTRSQALATMAICRNYSMTRDPQWARPAQFALNELCRASHRPHLTDTSPEVVFWQLLALVESHMSSLNVDLGAVADLKKWYAFRIEKLPESSWQGSEFVGIRKFALLSREKFKVPVQHYIERSVDQLSVLEQFATATAYVEVHFAETAEPLQRLKAVVLSQVAREGDLFTLALRVMVRQSRFPKLIWSREPPEDDFPLMKKHEDL